jgi:hypothetical protein
VSREAPPRSTSLLGPRVRLTAAIGVGLLALILVAAGIPALHVHAGHETGLYDEDCPLVTLSLGPAKAVLYDPPNAPHRSTTSEPSPLAHPPVLFALPLATLRARAPPTAG